MVITSYLFAPTVIIGVQIHLPHDDGSGSCASLNSFWTKLHSNAVLGPIDKSRIYPLHTTSTVSMLSEVP